MFNRITLDRPNNNAYFTLNGIEHLFSSYDKFVSLTNFNFNTVILNYEPDRNIFIVENLGGEIKSGSDLEEIKWCVDNINNIISAAYEDGYGKISYTPTLEEIRNVKLLETDWMVTRHRDQLDNNNPTTLSVGQYKLLLDYRQQLRDITNLYSTLDDVVWPILDI